MSCLYFLISFISFVGTVAQNRNMYPFLLKTDENIFSLCMPLMIFRNWEPAPSSFCYIISNKHKNTVLLYLKIQSNIETKFKEVDVTTYIFRKKTHFYQCVIGIINSYQIDVVKIF